MPSGSLLLLLLGPQISNTDSKNRVVDVSRDGAISKTDSAISKGHNIQRLTAQGLTVINIMIKTIVLEALSSYGGNQ